MGSQYPLDLSRVSVAVQHKVCQLSALDYCCLNYRLPPICEGVVSCRWREQTTTKTSRRAATRKQQLLQSHNASSAISSVTTNTSMSTSTNASTSISNTALVTMLMIEP